MMALGQALSLSKAIILESMKGGSTMSMVTYLAMAILNGDYTLEEIKNKRVRRLVEKELEKLKMAEVTKTDAE